MSMISAWSAGDPGAARGGRADVFELCLELVVPLGQRRELLGGQWVDRSELASLRLERPGPCVRVDALGGLGPWCRQVLGRFALEVASERVRRGLVAGPRLGDRYFGPLALLARLV